VAEEPVQVQQEAEDSSSEHLEVENVTEGGWTQWFCSLEGNGFFVEIEEDYIKDQLNMYGIKHHFDKDHFKYLREINK
jgi:casein kinase II subunit beta